MTQNQKPKTGPARPKRDRAVTLLVKEVYPAILGEGLDAGRPGLIVRLTGCNLRCSYCDTAQAYSGGSVISVAALMKQVRQHGPDRVLVTGGEPLLQPATPALLAQLVTAGFRVILETNGSLELRGLPRQTHVVMDLKTPGSGHARENLMENLEALKPSDEIKFVLVDRGDYLWARRTIARHELDRGFQVSLSPVHGRLEPRLLAEWMLKDRLRARLGLQVHKYIFGPDEPRT